MDEVIQEFVTESRENLDRVEQDLIELEKNPTQKERIAGIFRAVHTVKGTCGFLELRQLEKVAHSGENLLSRLRDGEVAYGRDIASALLELVDAIRGMVASVAATGKDGDEAFMELIAKLDALAVGADAPAEPRSEPLTEHTPAVPTAQRGMSVPAVEAKPAPKPSRAKRAAPAQAVAPAPVPPPPAARALAPEPAPVAPSQRATPVFATPPGPVAERPPAPPATRGATIRVDVGVLDELMNLVGELVLARNQLLELTSNQLRSPLVATSQRLNQITTELQSRVMKTRMQPIGNVWNKVPRVARELAMQCGKEALVELDGSETELDKTVLEAISEPLAHIVRNCVDHGIEPPAKRVAVGKPPQGKLSLSARHEGGHVVIDIGDDGAGVDVERVKQKALEKGLVTPERAAQMSDPDAFSLLFSPGFSTAERVTNISGRGVGMDVVRTNIERIGGTVEIRSVRGQGTTFRVRLPLTLAIVPAIIVASGGQRFAIPQLGLQELLRLKSESGRVEHVHGAPVYRLRGRLLPLVWLADVLELPAASAVPRERGEGQIVVLQAESGTFGLVVEEVSNSEEVVVKPLTELLSGLSVYAGATILGDGSIALILDASNLAKRARGPLAAAPQAPPRTEPVALARGRESESMVLCLSASKAPIAVPLRQVERLEKFRLENLESSGGRAVIQYRGQIIPVFGVEDGYESIEALGTLSDSGLLHALVLRDGRRAAVVVQQIVDVVEHEGGGAAPTAVIAQRVTELVDLDAVVQRRAHLFEALHGAETSRESAA